MSRATGSIGVVFIVLTIALAATGAAYALWFKDLVITANVETDTVDVRYSNESNPGADGTLGDGTTDPVSGCSTVPTPTGFGCDDTEGPFTNDDGVVDNPIKDLLDDDLAEVYDAHECGPLPADTCSSGDASGPGHVGTPATRVSPLKDVGICTVAKKSDEMVLSVSIKDSYPSYWCTVWYDVLNVGSVPVVLQGIDLITFIPGGTKNFEPISPSQWWCIDTDGITGNTQVTGTIAPDFTCPNVPEPDTPDLPPAAGNEATDQKPQQYDLMVHVSELTLDAQVDPGDPPLQGNLDVHVEQGAQQGHTGSGALMFQINMHWVQWNES